MNLLSTEINLLSKHQFIKQNKFAWQKSKYMHKKFFFYVAHQYAFPLEILMGLNTPRKWFIWKTSHLESSTLILASISKSLNISLFMNQYRKRSFYMPPRNDFHIPTFSYLNNFRQHGQAGGSNIMHEFMWAKLNLRIRLVTQGLHW